MLLLIAAAVVSLVIGEQVEAIAIMAIVILAGVLGFTQEHRAERTGSVTVAGAVSPPGADFSEPVTQNTLRITDALYSLDVSLANRRHFPAINWLTSYSLYAKAVEDWWSEVSPEWADTRATALKLLQQEAELEEVVRLVGPEALPEGDKLVLLVARMMREEYPHVVCHDGSPYLFKQKELEYLASLIDTDEQEVLLLPLLIEVGPGQGEMAIVCQGHIEEKVISRILGMPINLGQERINIYYPQLAQLRKLLKTTTQYLFRPKILR